MPPEVEAVPVPLSDEGVPLVVRRTGELTVREEFCAGTPVLVLQALDRCAVCLVGTDVELRQCGASATQCRDAFDLLLDRVVTRLDISGLQRPDLACQLGVSSLALGGVILEARPVRRHRSLRQWSPSLRILKLVPRWKCARNGFPGRSKRLSLRIDAFLNVTDGAGNVSKKRDLARGEHVVKLVVHVRRRPRARCKDAHPSQGRMPASLTHASVFAAPLIEYSIEADGGGDASLAWAFARMSSAVRTAATPLSGRGSTLLPGTVSDETERSRFASNSKTWLAAKALTPATSDELSELKHVPQ